MKSSQSARRTTEGMYTSKTLKQAYRVEAFIKMREEQTTENNTRWKIAQYC